MKRQIWLFAKEWNLMPRTLLLTAHFEYRVSVSSNHSSYSGILVLAMAEFEASLFCDCFDYVNMPASSSVRTASSI